MGNTSREEIVEIAKRYLGYPSCAYRRSDVENHGCNESGFTCSGFVRFVIGKSGIEIPDRIRHSREFFDHFGVAIHAERVQSGDLVFFSPNGIFPKHMGIVVSDDEYISSPGKKDDVVKIRKMKGTYKSDIDQEDPRVLYVENPIGFKRIALPDGTYQEILKA